MTLPLTPTPGSPPPPLPSDGHAVTEFLTLAGKDFRVRETDHFMIAYDTPDEALLPSIDRLEGTYDAVWRFCEGCGLAPTAPTARLKVLLFDRYDHFARYNAGIGTPAASVAGFYDQRTNMGVFCNALNSPGLQPIVREIERIREDLKLPDGGPSDSRAIRQRRADLLRDLSGIRSQRDALVRKFNRLVIQHEAAHQMLFNLGVHVRGAENPPWLVEGLACQFELRQAASTGGSENVNHLRLADLRNGFSVGPEVKSISVDACKGAFHSGRLVPLVDLITNRGLFARHDADTAYHYAQAWGLVYYLHRERREAFTGYLRQLRNRAAGHTTTRATEIELFERAFGEPNDAFQHAWAAYMLKLRLEHPEAGR